MRTEQQSGIYVNSYLFYSNANAVHAPPPGQGAAEHAEMGEQRIPDSFVISNVTWKSFHFVIYSHSLCAFHGLKDKRITRILCLIKLSFIRNNIHILI